MLGSLQTAPPPQLGLVSLLEDCSVLSCLETTEPGLPLKPSGDGALGREVRDGQAFCDHSPHVKPPLDLSCCQAAMYFIHSFFHPKTSAESLAGLHHVLGAGISLNHTYTFAIN